MDLGRSETRGVKSLVSYGNEPPLTLAPSMAAAHFKKNLNRHPKKPASHKVSSILKGHFSLHLA